MNYENVEVIDLTRKLVQIESTNIGTFEEKISLFIEDWLRKNTHAEVVREEIEPKRFNVVATLKGKTSHPNLIYIAHMDTVPFGEGWTVTAPLSGDVRDGKIWGRGACDMKAGIAAAMIAFRDIENECRAKSITPEMDFVFVASADEEDAMKGADRIVDLGIADKQSLVLDTEPTGPLNNQGDYTDDSKLYILMAHKGKSWFEITTYGTSAHGSTPYRGVNAIVAMAHVVLEIQGRLAQLPAHPVMGPSTACFGTIAGGLNTNMVAEKCAMTIDMRISPPLTVEASYQLVADAIEAGTAKEPGSTGEYTVMSKRPFVNEDPDSVLMNAVKASCKKMLAREAESFFAPCYTDSGVIGGRTDNGNSMSFGPYGSELHTPNEYADCRSIIDVEKVLADVARGFLLK